MRIRTFTIKTSFADMFEKLMKNADWIAIPFGIIALTLSFAGIDNHYLIWFIRIAGAMAVIYTIYALYLFIFRRPMFDWHLLHGHFLRKVFSLILLTPFLLTAATYIWIKNPKEMVFDENLYECKENSLPCDIKKEQESPNIFWSTYYHFIDPGNQHMTTTKAGRIYSALVAILGMFLLNGLLVSSIIGWIDRRKDNITNGNVRYKLRHLGKSRFAVVLGANEIASSVIRNLLTPKRKGEINYKCEGNNRYVILQTSRKAEKVRTELASYLNEEELKKVIIYKAQRDSRTEIDHLYTRYSTEIYILGESTTINGGETYHDAMNMRCVNLIAEKLEKTREKREKAKSITDRSVRKVCKVMFEYQTTYSIFQFSDISKEVNENLVFIPFNRYESWARKVMVDNIALKDISAEAQADSGTDTNSKETKKYIQYTPLDGNGIRAEDNTHVHFVVVGMSNMGIAMGTQAMLQAHYLNYANEEKKEMEANMTAEEKAASNKRREKLRTRITFIDTNADKEMAFFKGRYENLFKITRNRYIDATKCDKECLIADSIHGWIDPVAEAGNEWKHLSDNNRNFIDIEVEFIKGEIESENIRQYLKNISDNNNTWVKESRLTLAICMTQTHQAVAASLYMPIQVYDKAQEIWVYQRESADIILNLRGTEQKDKRYKELKPFGMLYGEYMSDRNLYLKALLANGAYDLNGAEYKKEKRNMNDKKTYKDIRETWKMLTLDKKYSNKYFVDSFDQKIRSVMSHESSNLKAAITKYKTELAICEHNRWNVQQLLLGYSPCNKDEDMKFQSLNANCNTEQAKEEYNKWKKDVSWSSLSPKERILKKQEADYLKTTKGNFDKEKNTIKIGSYRKHPNICCYDHLDNVDSGAKSYDEYLNNAIPDIIELVDGKKRNKKTKTNND